MAKPSKAAAKEQQRPYICGFCQTGIGWRIVTVTGRTRCPGSMPYASAGKPVVCACAESGHDTGACGDAKARAAAARIAGAPELPGVSRAGLDALRAAVAELNEDLHLYGVHVTVDVEREAAS